MGQDNSKRLLVMEPLVQSLLTAARSCEKLLVSVIISNYFSS
jgi:hypothetical protein